VSAAAQQRVLVTGGAGFVGANLAIALAGRHPDWEIVALDNLKRRGSELNLPRLRAAGVLFEQGDVRSPEDLQAIPKIDALVECSAEPSVLAGVDGSPDYVVRTNLFGAWHCLELARRDSAQIVFLSTSRVYPVDPLTRLRLDETDTRYELSDDQPVGGASSKGISEQFPMDGARTIYGTTKLSAEMLVEEYRESYGLKTVVNRCGVIAGPWQMGKLDQGVFAFWMLAHRLGNPLKYIGFDGSGRQVRDLLHVDDLVELLDDQLLRPDHWNGFVANVGGGRECSLSLVETTALCREITGLEVPVESAGVDRPGDIPVYISDCSRLFAHTDWRPARSARDVLVDLNSWISDHQEALVATVPTT
jgi:CDP-paratose 2-epimerase